MLGLGPMSPNLNAKFYISLTRTHIVKPWFISIDDSTTSIVYWNKHVLFTWEIIFHQYNLWNIFDLLFWQNSPFHPGAHPEEQFPFSLLQTSEFKQWQSSSHLSPNFPSGHTVQFTKENVILYNPYSEMKILTTHQDYLKTIFSKKSFAKIDKLIFSRHCSIFTKKQKTNKLETSSLATAYPHHPFKNLNQPFLKT